MIPSYMDSQPCQRNFSHETVDTMDRWRFLVREWLIPAEWFANPARIKIPVISIKKPS